MSYARRKDTAHKPIVADLEQCGFVCFDVSRASGLGMDVLVYWPAADLWMPFEIKTPTPTPGAQRGYQMRHRKARTHTSALTESEKRAAQRAPVQMVTTAEQIIAHFQERAPRGVWLREEAYAIRITR